MILYGIVLSRHAKALRGHFGPSLWHVRFGPKDRGLKVGLGLALPGPYREVRGWFL